jgi:hypothetical protein
MHPSKLKTLVGIACGVFLIGSVASADPWARSYSNRAWGNWSAGGSTPWFAGGGGTLRNGGFPGGISGYPSYHRAPSYDGSYSQPSFRGGSYYSPSPRMGAPVMGGGLRRRY